MSKNFLFQIIKNSNKGLSLSKDCSYFILKKEKKNWEIYARGYEA